MTPLIFTKKSKMAISMDFSNISTN